MFLVNIQVRKILSSIILIGHSGREKKAKTLGKAMTNYFLQIDWSAQNREIA